MKIAASKIDFLQVDVEPRDACHARESFVMGAAGLDRHCFLQTLGTFKGQIVRDINDRYVEPICQPTSDQLKTLEVCGAFRELVYAAMRKVT